MNLRCIGWELGRSALGLVVILWGAVAGSGCGGMDEGPTGLRGGGGAPASELAAVDPANDASYRAWLKANEVEAPEVSLSGHRGAGGDASGWPLLPRGDVRLEGLSVWRFEVDAMSFEPEACGVLEFRKGKNVLWRDSTPFSPASRIVQGGLPKSVLDAVKVGDTVTWGVVYDKEPKRSLLAEFKVVNKPSAAKQIDRLENDRRNARQSARVKSLGRNQALLNNSLFAEALRGYMDLAVGESNDPIVQEACYRIVECLRRLQLDESLLYIDAMALAARKKGKSKPGAEPSVGGPAPERGLEVAGEYVSSGAKPLPEPMPPEPTPTPPPGPSRTTPTDPSTRRGFAAVEEQATQAQQRFAQSEAIARQQADEVAAHEAKTAALRLALDAAKGTPDEAGVRAALLAAEAGLARAKGEAAAAQAAQGAATHDQSMIQKLREMAQAPPPRHEPGNPDANWKAMAERAKQSDTEADARLAKSTQLDMLAGAAEAAGKSDAADMRAAADVAALAAAAARQQADDAQLRLEQAFHQLPPPAPGAPPTGPAQVDRVAVLTGWAERLREEGAALLSAAEAKAKQAHDADAAGDPNAATLLVEARNAKQAAEVAARRAQAAKRALDALLHSLEPTPPGGG